MCVQTITCIQQGKGHFRRTRMHTHAWFVHHLSVCMCMRDTGECDAFKPRAKATVNPKHTRYHTQDLFAPATRHGKHGIFIRTQKYKQSNTHPLHTASGCHTSNPPTKTETDSDAPSCRIIPQDKSKKKTPRTWVPADRVRWWCLLAFWRMPLRDTNCSAIRHSEKVGIQNQDKKHQNNRGVALAANGAPTQNLPYPCERSSERVNEWRQIQLGETSRLLMVKQDARSFDSEIN
jgi:hypothetical protein